MSKTLSGLIEETQKHIIVETLYFIGDTHPPEKTLDKLPPEVP